jgi:hypothetical protein
LCPCHRTERAATAERLIGAQRAYLKALSIKLPPTINQIELNKLQSGIR